MQTSSERQRLIAQWGHSVPSNVTLAVLAVGVVALMVVSVVSQYA